MPRTSRKLARAAAFFRRRDGDAGGRVAMFVHSAFFRSLVALVLVVNTMSHDLTLGAICVGLYCGELCLRIWAAGFDAGRGGSGGARLWRILEVALIVLGVVDLCLQVKSSALNESDARSTIMQVSLLGRVARILHLYDCLSDASQSMRGSFVRSSSFAGFAAVWVVVTGVIGSDPSFDEPHWHGVVMLTGLVLHSLVVYIVFDGIRQQSQGRSSNVLRLLDNQVFLALVHDGLEFHPCTSNIQVKNLHETLTKQARPQTRSVMWYLVYRHILAPRLSPYELQDAIILELELASRLDSDYAVRVFLDGIATGSMVTFDNFVNGLRWMHLPVEVRNVQSFRPQPNLAFKPAVARPWSTPSGSATSKEKTQREDEAECKMDNPSAEPGDMLVATTPATASDDEKQSKQESLRSPGEQQEPASAQPSSQAPARLQLAPPPAGRSSLLPLHNQTEPCG